MSSAAYDTFKGCCRGVLRSEGEVAPCCLPFLFVLEPDPALLRVLQIHWEGNSTANLGWTTGPPPDCLVICSPWIQYVGHLQGVSYRYAGLVDSTPLCHVRLPETCIWSWTMKEQRPEAQNWSLKSTANRGPQPTVAKQVRGRVASTFNRAAGPQHESPTKPVQRRTMMQREWPPLPQGTTGTLCGGIDYLR